MIEHRQTTYMATIDVFREDGVRLVRKTVEPPGIGSRKLGVFGFLATWMCLLEVKALKALKGVKGIPQFVRRNSSNSFTTLYMESTPIYLAPDLRADYFDRLFLLLEAVHARGVVDLDLIHRRDTAVDLLGNPVLLDFGFCLTFRQPVKGLRKKLFEYLCTQHRIRYIEMREVYFPGRITSEEKRMAGKWYTLPKIERGMHDCRRLLIRSAQRVLRSAGIKQFPE